MRLITLLTLLFIGWLGGFVAYVYDADQLTSSVSKLKSQDTSHKHADAIVVLTGGKNRIKEGFRILQAKEAPKLLVSGVLKHYPKSKLIRNAGFQGRIPKHRIFIDYQATNTVENASYSHQWIKTHNVKSIILVTSTYHMRRALLEFRQKNPSLNIQPFGVNPLSRGKGPWSRSEKILGLYLLEYTKYLGVLIQTNLLYLGKQLVKKL